MTALSLQQHDSMMGGPQPIAHETAESLEPVDLISKGRKRFVSLLSNPLRRVGNLLLDEPWSNSSCWLVSLGAVRRLTMGYESVDGQRCEVMESRFSIWTLPQ